jgi:hypothetical protein
MLAMAVLAIIAIVFVAMFLRMLIFFAKIFFFAIGVAAIVMLAVQVQHAAVHAGAYMHAHGLQIVLAGVAIAAVGALAFAGGRELWRRLQIRLEPFYGERRLRRAAAALKRAHKAVTASALANAAQIDVDSTLAWLARNPRFMPSAPNVPAWK